MNAAYGILTPLYYRLEVQQMVEVTYPDGVTVVEPDVGQGNLAGKQASLPEDVVVGPRWWGVYGRQVSGVADLISDCTDFNAACLLCEHLGGYDDIVPPGPLIECHGKQVSFLHDGYWPEDIEMQREALLTLASRASEIAYRTVASVLVGTKE